MRRGIISGLVAAVAFGSMGCMGGGKMMPMGKQVPGAKTLATYKVAETGAAPIILKLLSTDRGLACLEEASDGSALATTHWVESDGDHFQMWVEILSQQGGAFEMVFPKNRKANGRRYFYPPGAYAIIGLGGSDRAVPADPSAHKSARLVPMEVTTN